MSVLVKEETRDRVQTKINRLCAVLEAKKQAARKSKLDDDNELIRVRVTIKFLNQSTFR